MTTLLSAMAPAALCLRFPKQKEILEEMRNYGKEKIITKILVRIKNSILHRK